MASAPTLPLVSVEEYLRTGYEHDMEFVEGVLIERGMPTPAHSALQTIVADSGVILASRVLPGQDFTSRISVPRPSALAT